MFLIPCILTKLINLFTLVTREVSKINLHNNQNYKMSFYRLFVNLGIGIGIGTDITNVIISSSVRPMDPKLSRVVT